MIERAGPRVRDHGGIAIGAVHGGGVVEDFAGVRIGIAGADGSVRDFSGVRVGAVVHGAHVGT